MNYDGIETRRWEKGIEHDLRSERMARIIGQIDYNLLGDSLCLKFGGDGDNGEQLMYAMDVYFEMVDKGRI